MLAANESQVLKRLDYPAYCIKLLDNGLVAIAGGGGTSKTGVRNSLEIGHINYFHSSPSSAFRAEYNQIAEIGTEDAIMKFVSFTTTTTSTPSTTSNNNVDHYIAAALNSTIEIYKIQPRVVTTTPQSEENSNHHQNDISGGGIKRRNRSTSSSKQQNGLEGGKEDNKQKWEASVELKLVNSVRLRPDEASNESITGIQVYKKKKKASVTMTKDKKKKKDEEENDDEDEVIMMCVGTSTGSIVVWSLEFERNNNLTNKINLVKLHECKQAHGNMAEIDELQVNNEGILISVSKDKTVIWSLETTTLTTINSSLTKITDLNYTSSLNNDTNLRMKHARFSHDSNYLYTTYTHRIRNGSRNLFSFIQKWRRTQTSSNNTTTTTKFNYTLERTFKLNTLIASIQVSRDGLFVCIGDYEGMIYLFDLNFNKIKHFKKLHSSVVTGLLFYHDCELPTKTISTTKKPPPSLQPSYDINKLILSIGIDRTIQLNKFINTDQSLVSNLVTPPKSAFLVCLCSMKLFRFTFILIVIFLLFCYFFTYIE